ncbi:unnamed protein product [Durusdinium trenchii]|uniref:Uncharacterized protein n=1 Tax=Durusdinium trenchii TaxID=1381693 RepID=A0ABP0K8B0_9DINO
MISSPATVSVRWPLSPVGPSRNARLLFDARRSHFPAPRLSHLRGRRPGIGLGADGTDSTDREGRWRRLSLGERLLQPIQLCLAIWLLLLLPAGLASSHLCGGWALGLMPFEYLAFFLVGTVPRAWRFGTYARPAKGKPGTRRQDFVLFLLAIFMAHNIAAATFVWHRKVLCSWWQLPRFAAIVLNGSAAWHLGRTLKRCPF